MTALLMFVKPAGGSTPRHTSLIIEVESDKFNEALALLNQYPKHKAYVESRLTKIKSGVLSKVIITSDTAVFHISDRFIEGSSVEYLASTLVHEAKHVDQRRPFLVFDDQTAELDANNFQAMALLDMNGSRYQIDQLMDADGLHFDTNGNGRLDSEDNWGW